MDARQDGKSAFGSIDVLDVRFGSIWTNIPIEYIKNIGIKHGDNLEVKIYHKDKKSVPEYNFICKKFCRC
uniref:SAM hydroxide adenosyltransferase n=1 Tax=Clostridium sp. NkU-1 TaxID=1095009 RepID=UPI0032601892